MKPDSAWVQKPINALTLIAGIVVVIMMLHICADVAGRLLFDHPFDGTLEIVSNYYMVGVIFLPLAYVSHNEGHIMVELFTRKMPERRLAGLDAIVDLVCLAFLVWFTWENIVSAWLSTMHNEQTGTATGLLTIWPSRWILPIGLTMMAIYIALRLIADIRKAAAGK